MSGRRGVNDHTYPINYGYHDMGLSTIIATGYDGKGSRLSGADRLRALKLAALHERVRQQGDECEKLIRLSIIIGHELCRSYVLSTREQMLRLVNSLGLYIRKAINSLSTGKRCSFSKRNAEIIATVACFNVLRENGIDAVELFEKLRGNRLALKALIAMGGASRAAERIIYDINVYGKKLGIDNGVTLFAERLAMLWYRQGLLIGVRPRSIAAAAIYTALKVHGHQVSMNKIADIFNISEPTIRNVLKRVMLIVIYTKDDRIIMATAPGQYNEGKYARGVLTPFEACLMAGIETVYAKPSKIEIHDNGGVIRVDVECR